MWFSCFGPLAQDHDNYGEMDVVIDEMRRGVMAAWEDIVNGAHNPTHGVVRDNPYWIKTPLGYP